MQTNQQHFSTASSSLAQLILDFNIDIVFVQEPYTILQGNSTFFPKVPTGYIVRHWLDHNAAYGAAIIIKKCISSRIITDHSSNNVIGVEIELGTQPYRIYSVYCRPSTVRIADTIQKIINDSTTNIKRQIICMDTNAHNPLWNSSNSDDKGRELEEIIAEISLNICNSTSDLYRNL